MLSFDLDAEDFGGVMGLVRLVCAQTLNHLDYVHSSRCPPENRVLVVQPWLQELVRSNCTYSRYSCNEEL